MHWLYEHNILPAESFLLDYIKGQECIISSPWFALSTDSFKEFL